MSLYKVTTHVNHCSVPSLIECDWHIFSKLKAMNVLYKYSFQTYGKEETLKIEVVSEAKTQVTMSGF